MINSDEQVLWVCVKNFLETHEIGPTFISYPFPQ